MKLHEVMGISKEAYDRLPEGDVKPPKVPIYAIVKDGLHCSSCGKYRVFRGTGGLAECWNCGAFNSHL